MKLHKLIIMMMAFGLVFAGKATLFAQDDDDNGQEVQEMDEDEWQKQMDELNGQKTQLNQKLGDLNKDIDALKQTSAQKDKDVEKCTSDLYSMVGTTQSGVADFRKKFEETERKINSKTGTPADARKSYFDDISNDKERCLPEFQDRYASMKKKLEDWEGQKPDMSGTYTVVKGDCLWKISKAKYGSPYFWPAIWDANKAGVVNKDQMKNKRHSTITNPNLIYPGQVLKIPQLTDAQKKEAEMKAHKYRKTRRHKKEEMKKDEKKDQKDMKKDTKKDEKKDVKKDTKKDDTKKDMKKIPRIQRKTRLRRSN